MDRVTLKAYGGSGEYQYGITLRESVRDTSVRGFPAARLETATTSHPQYSVGDVVMYAQTSVDPAEALDVVASLGPLSGRLELYKPFPLGITVHVTDGETTAYLDATVVAPGVTGSSSLVEH